MESATRVLLPWGFRASRRPTVGAKRVGGRWVPRVRMKRDDVVKGHLSAVGLLARLGATCAADL